MIRLMAFDLDGTLLDDRNRLPAANRSALGRAVTKGVQPVIATGRNYSEVPPDVMALPIRYFITANGGYVYDRQKDQVLYSHCLTLEQAQYVLSLGKMSGGYPMFYIGRRVYVSPDFTDYMKTMTDPGNYEILAKDYHPCDNIAGEAGADRYTQKVVLFFKNGGERARALDQARSDGRICEFEISSSYPDNAEFNPKGVNKGVGLRTIMERLRIPADEVAAIGDSSNDIPMLKVAGHPFAIGNSVPEVKSLVPEDHVMPSHVQGGAACMIEACTNAENHI